jgi:hypothetical protein
MGHLLILGRTNCLKWRQKIEFVGHLGFDASFKLRAKIQARGDTIYRGFDTQIVFKSQQIRRNRKGNKLSFRQKL